MTYTHMPNYIYVIIAEQFVITNLSGRKSVRTLHVDCVVSYSSPVHGHGVRSLQSQGGHCDCHCSEVMLFTA